MRMALALIVAVLALAAADRRASAQEIIADLSDHLVAITTGFAGAKVLLFGAVDGDGDVVVVVRGPDTDTVVRRKSQVNGMWINTHSVTFSGVPGYYAVAASKPVGEIVTDAVAVREQIGADRLRLTPEPGTPPEIAETFRHALIRNMQATGLFQPRDGTVRFLGQRLFRAEIAFPANVPTGRYTVNVFLVRGGQVVGGATTPLLVSKIGLSAEIFDFAQERGLIYGIIAVTFAAMAGWAASRVFQRA